MLVVKEQTFNRVDLKVELVLAVHEPGSIPVSKQRVPLSAVQRRRFIGGEMVGQGSSYRQGRLCSGEGRGLYQAEDIAKVEIPDRLGEADTAVRLVFILGGA